jgi:uncharacterized repeat protein (TIGR04138 family)
MGQERSDEEKLAELLEREARYKAEAYFFVREALEHTRGQLGRSGHVSGRELAEGVRDLARERFGLLGKAVLEGWGVRTTSDIGSLVYNMIQAKIMVKQESDRREDFDNVYDFARAFEENFEIVSRS